MSNSLGTLTLDLVAKMGGWVEGFTQAERATKAETRKMQKSIKEVEKSVKSLGSTLRNVAGLIGLTLTVSAFDGCIRGGVQAAATAGVFADKVGVTVEELTAFRYIATEAGSSADVLDDSIKRLNSRLGDAIHGKGPAIKTLERINLNAKELISMPLEAKFRAISEAMKGLDRGEQLRILQNIAGDSARDLIRMFDLSKDEISDLTARAERLGFVYSTEMAQSADVVLSKLDEMKRAFGNLSLQIISEFLPDVEEFLNSITLEDLEGHMETARVVIDNLGVATHALALAYSVKLAAGIGISTAAMVNKGRVLLYTTAKTHLLKGATESAALAMGRQAVAANVLRVSLGALGGPMGLALMVAGSFIFLKKSQQNTKKSTDELLLSVKNLTEGYENLSAAEAKHQRNVLSDEIKELKAQVRENNDAAKSLREERDKIQQQLDDGTWQGEFVRKSGFIGWDKDINKAKDRLDEIQKKEDELESQQYKLNTAIKEGSKGLSALSDIANKAESSLQGLGDGMDAAQKNLGKMLNKIQLDTERMGLKTKVEIFNHEWNKTTQWDEYKVGDDQEQERVKAQIAAAFAEQDAKEKTLRISTKSIDIAAEYRKVMEGTLSDEERRGQELAKNLDILKQYGASEEDMLAVRRAAYDSMSIEMPDMGEGGNTLTAQLARLGENMAQLDAWREEQLIKLELAYGNEESALAESLEKREELERQYRERRSQFEGEMNQELLNLSLSMTSDSLSALREAGMESTAIGKAVFFMNRGISASNTIVSALAAGTKATETLPGMPGVALGKAITAMGMVNAGLIMGTGLKGMAHSGLDKVPETGTWLLEKGERVVTSNTSAKLDATLENLRNKGAGNSSGDVYSSINVTINKDGETESESEVGGTAFANLVKGLVVDIISREMKPGGTLAKR